ncbi:hypothetical protein C9374_002957 [Naegleria lovaniensis]|uniref:Uncharacterized protein n=1 Tax=Naegleria lovaniensis TaxID=51637 RepID=A0AA88KKI6_NAELO|nr:uncharacterized protein C9374_002957 [Naegleria lovaniensis]KAG2385808.1 hypothetical protein C9374_002957 [Naegleria lovaniensis]
MSTDCEEADATHPSTPTKQTDNKKRIKAILFGLDGLIRNINDINYQVWNGILTEYGYDLNFQEYLQIFLFLHEMYVLFQLLPYNTADEHLEIAKRKQKEFVNFITKQNVLSTASLSGMEKLLESIKKHNESTEEEENKIVIGVVSDLSNTETKCLLEKLNLFDYFDVVLSSYGLKRPKPDPSIYKVALEQLKVDPDECIVFEGTTQGCLASMRALQNSNVIGINCNDISNEIDSKEMFDNGVKTILDNFEGLELSHLELMIE